MHAKELFGLDLLIPWAQSLLGKSRTVLPTLGEQLPRSDVNGHHRHEADDRGDDRAYRRDPVSDRGWIGSLLLFHLRWKEGR